MTWWFTFNKDLDSVWQENFKVKEGQSLRLTNSQLTVRSILKLSLVLPEASHLVKFTGDSLTASPLPLARALEHSCTLEAIYFKFKDSRRSELMRLGLALGNVKEARLEFMITGRILFSLGKCLEANNKRNFKCNSMAIKVRNESYRTLPTEVKYFLSSVEKHLGENYGLKHWVSYRYYPHMTGSFVSTVARLPENQSRYLQSVIPQKNLE